MAELGLKEDLQQGVALSHSQESGGIKSAVMAYLATYGPSKVSKIQATLCSQLITAEDVEKTIERLLVTEEIRKLSWGRIGL
jgi:hypothetical protein